MRLKLAGEFLWQLHVGWDEKKKAGRKSEQRGRGVAPGLSAMLLAGKAEAGGVADGNCQVLHAWCVIMRVVMG